MESVSFVIYPFQVSKVNDIRFTFVWVVYQFLVKKPIVGISVDTNSPAEINGKDYRSHDQSNANSQDKKNRFITILDKFCEY